MITHLEEEIADDPISGLKRKIVHYEFILHRNLEMTSEREIVFYEKLPDGSYGRPITQVIVESDLTEDQKREALKTYSPKRVKVNTASSYVNPATGIPVQPDENGNYPEGSVLELEFWQSLPINFIQPPPTTVAQAIYTLIKMSMKSGENQGRY